MPKTRQQKEEIVSELLDLFQNSTSAVFFNFFGLPVAEIEKLRRECRKESVSYKVGKKTLMNRALTQAGYDEVLSQKLDGEVAVVFGKDEVTPAKVVSKFAKDHEQIKFVGGVLERHFIASDAVKALSKIPSRQELYGSLVGSLASPLRSLLAVFNGPARGLVQVLSQVQSKKS